MAAAAVAVDGDAVEMQGARLGRVMLLDAAAVVVVVVGAVAVGAVALHQLHELHLHQRDRHRHWHLHQRDQHRHWQ